MAFVESLPSVSEGRTRSADPVFESKLAEAFLYLRSERQPRRDGEVCWAGGFASSSSFVEDHGNHEGWGGCAIAGRVPRCEVLCPRAVYSVCWQPVLLSTGASSFRGLVSFDEGGEGKGSWDGLKGLIWWQPAFRGPGSNFEQGRLSYIGDEGDAYSSSKRMRLLRLVETEVMVLYLRESSGMMDCTTCCRRCRTRRTNGFWVSCWEWAGWNKDWGRGSYERSWRCRPRGFEGNCDSCWVRQSD